jgi:hypothetical protein
VSLNLSSDEFLVFVLYLLFHLSSLPLTALEEIMSVLSSMLYVEREPLVSSLNGMLVSRDQTRNTLQHRERSADSGRGQTVTRGSNQSVSTRFPQSASSEKEAYKELQQNYEKL